MKTSFLRDFESTYLRQKAALRCAERSLLALGLRRCPFGASSCMIFRFFVCAERKSPKIQGFSQILNENQGFSMVFHWKSRLLMIFSFKIVFSHYFSLKNSIFFKKFYEFQKKSNENPCFSLFFFENSSLPIIFLRKKSLIFKSNLNQKHVFQWNSRISLDFTWKFYVLQRFFFENQSCT